MKPIRYILFYFLLFGVFGLLQAQKPEYLGRVQLNSQFVAAFRIPSAPRITAVQADVYSMNGFGVKSYGDILESKRPLDFFVSGTDLIFVILPEFETGNEVSLRFKLIEGAEEITSSVLDLQNGRMFDWIGSDFKDYQIESAKEGYKWIDQNSWGYPIPFYEKGCVKGVTSYAPGFFQMSVPEDTPYDLLALDYGTQTYDMDYSKSNGIHFTISKNGQDTDGGITYSPLGNPKHPPYSKSYVTTFLGGDVIKISGNPVDGNNSGDAMGFMMARLYYKNDARKEQKVENDSWPSESTLNIYQPTKIPLTAQFTSGEPAVYRIVAGEQYASINGTTLDIKVIPEGDYIEVEAFQPGTDSYKPSNLYRRRFSVTGNLIIHPNDRYVIQGDDPINELYVYGNSKSMGQIISDSYTPEIRKMYIKYTFVPGEWNFMTFPANVNIEDISDLKEKGYSYNRGQKAFYIMEYSTQNRALHPEKTAWKALETPVVEAQKGYIMGISRSEDNPNNEPVEITFVLDNNHVQLNAKQYANMRLSLDFHGVKVGDEIPIYIDPVNAVGNTLQLYVKFSPKDVSMLPLNYSNEVNEARITFNPNRSGIRLTLPTSEPAKVLIFNERGKMVRAVRYEAPQLIPIEDLKSGVYDLLIEYGGARCFKQFTVEK